MKEDVLYDIFHTLSRVIIICAVIIFITGLIIRFNQKKSNIQIPVAKQKPTMSISTSAAALNLKGPFVCNFSSHTATVSAFVKDINVYGKIKQLTKTTLIILKGDCIYSWEDSSSEGGKICGLSPFLSMFGQLPLTNLLDNNQLASLAGGYGINQTMITSILNSCKKSDMIHNSVFSLPMHIIFKERKL